MVCRFGLGYLNQLKLTAGTERIDDLNEFRFDRQQFDRMVPQHYYLSYAADRNQILTNTQEFLLEAETNVTSALETVAIVRKYLSTN